MSDSARLLKWMKDNNYTSRSLATKIGITHTGIHYMTSGKRPVSDAFKFRFIHRFGVEEASQIFDVTQQAQSALPVPTP